MNQLSFYSLVYICTCTWMQYSNRPKILSTCLTETFFRLIARHVFRVQKYNRFVKCSLFCSLCTRWSLPGRSELIQEILISRKGVMYRYGNYDLMVSKKCRTIGPICNRVLPNDLVSSLLHIGHT